MFVNNSPIGPWSDGKNSRTKRNMADIFDDQLRERLRYVLSSRNISQAELARRAQISHTNLNRFLIDRRKGSLSYETIIKISKALEVPVSFLFGEDIPGVNVLTLDVYNSLPARPSSRCGCMITDKILVGGEEDAFWLKCVGSKLQPKIAHGDMVLLAKENAFEDGQLVILSQGNVMKIKRIQRNGDQACLVAEYAMDSDHVCVVNDDLNCFRVLCVISF